MSNYSLESGTGKKPRKSQVANNPTFVVEKLFYVYTRIKTSMFVHQVVRVDYIIQTISFKLRIIYITMRLSLPSPNVFLVRYK